MTRKVAPEPDASQVLRDLVDEVLRDHVLPSRSGKLNDWTEAPHSWGGVTQKVLQEAKKRGLPTDGQFWHIIAEHLWTLARIGGLALLPRDLPINPGLMPQEHRGIPSFVITDLGYRLLTEPGFSPHDWGKYKASTLLRVAAPDDVVLLYLEEAVLAYQGGLYRASVVMLGCACERLIVRLATAVRDASLTPYSDKLRTMLASTKPVGISLIFEQVQRALVEAAKLPPELEDAIGRKLIPIFEYARGLRNIHGHPTGALVTAEETEAGLKLFPGFYALIDKLEQNLRRGLP